MAKLFVKCLKDTMLDVVVPSTDTYDKYVIIGSCYPRDNLLFKMKNGSYFPKKLEYLIENKPNIKYLLREKDIVVDLEAMNIMFIDLFNKMFEASSMEKILGKQFSNAFCISHSHLDCYAMFKTIKWAYGNSNCINLWKDKMHDQLQHLVAVNELISKYVQKKTEMNHSAALKQYAKEVKDYLREKIGS